MPGVWNPAVAEIVFAILLVIIPWSFSNIPTVLSCVLWLVGWGLGLHLIFSLFSFTARMPVFVKVALCVGLTGFLAAAAYQPIIKMWKEEKSSILRGYLNAPPGKSKEPMLQIGPPPGAPKFIWTGPQGGPIFDLVGSKLSIRRHNGRILLSTEVRDRNGAIVVNIVDNKWTVSSSQAVSWDKNYTRNSLEVKDGRGRIVLQVCLFPEYVQIQGEWWHENGTGVRILKREERGAAFIPLNQTILQDDPHIEPMFKYPSKENWGELATTK